MMSVEEIQSRKDSILLGLSGDHRKVILKEVCKQAKLLAELVQEAANEDAKTKFGLRLVAVVNMLLDRAWDRLEALQ